MQNWHLFIIYSPLYSLVVTDISKHVNVIKMHCTLFTKLKIRVQAFRGLIAGKEWVVHVTKSDHWSDSPILEMSLFNFSLITSVHISIRKLINIEPASAEATKVDCYCVWTQVQNKCWNRDKWKGQDDWQKLRLVFFSKSLIEKQFSSRNLHAQRKSLLLHVHWWGDHSLMWVSWLQDPVHKGLQNHSSVVKKSIRSLYNLNKGQMCVSTKHWESFGVCIEV